MRKFTLTLLLGVLSVATWATDAQQAFAFYKQKISTFPQEDSRAMQRYAVSLADNLETWLTQNPTNPLSADVLLWQARLFVKAEKYGEALVTLFRLRYLFPQTDMAQLTPLFNQAQDALEYDVREKASRFFVQVPSEKEPVKQVAKLLYVLSKLNGKTFYPVAVQAFERFFVQYPDYTGNEEVELWYGDLHRENKNYLAAILQYKKANDLYPDSPYKAASLRLIGDVYADNLKNTASATEVYTKVLRLYPNSAETGIVYKHMAILDENNKQYDSALLNYNRAIELLGNAETVYEAYRGKADVYYKQKQYEQAYDTLLATTKLQLSKEQAADSYEQAAKIAHKKLHDQARQIQALEKRALLEPTASQNAQRMYELANAYQKAGRVANAQETYKKLILQFPTSKYATKAQGRLTKLQKTK